MDASPVPIMDVKGSGLGLWLACTVLPEPGGPGDNVDASPVPIMDVKGSGLGRRLACPISPGFLYSIVSGEYGFTNS